MIIMKRKFYILQYKTTISLLNFRTVYCTYFVFSLSEQLAVAVIRSRILGLLRKKEIMPSSVKRDMKALFEKVGHFALDFFGTIRPPKTNKIDPVSFKLLQIF